MSSYTLQLRQLIETYGEDVVKSWFLDFDETRYLTGKQLQAINQYGWKKEDLAQDIIDFYYMREIGLETPDAFIHRVKVAMKRIMAEKLPVLYSMTLISDPLKTLSFSEDYQTDTSGKTKGLSKNKSSGLAVNSDTPMGQINKQEILDGKYASSTSGSENDSEINDSNETEGKTITRRTVYGTQGKNAIDIIEAYRKNIVNINQEIIDELSDVFMLLY